MTTKIRKYYSVIEAARFFGISGRTIYRMKADGIINFYHLGGRTLIKISEIENLITKE